MVLLTIIISPGCNAGSIDKDGTMNVSKNKTLPTTHSIKRINRIVTAANVHLMPLSIFHRVLTTISDVRFHKRISALPSHRLYSEAYITRYWEYS